MIYFIHLKFYRIIYKNKVIIIHRNRKNGTKRDNPKTPDPKWYKALWPYTTRYFSGYQFQYAGRFSLYHEAILRHQLSYNSTQFSY